MEEKLTAQDIIDIASEKPKFKKERLKIRITKKEIEKLQEQEKQQVRKKTPKKPKKKLEIKQKYLKYKRKLIDFFKKLISYIDNEDRNALKQFLIYCGFFGIMINFSVFSIFGLRFTFYSWLGWGFALWFIENKLITLIKQAIR